MVTSLVEHSFILDKAQVPGLPVHIGLELYLSLQTNSCVCSSPCLIKHLLLASNNLCCSVKPHLFYLIHFPVLLQFHLFVFLHMELASGTFFPYF